MYRIAVAALVVAATGCATTGGGGSREGNATVAGIIRLPQSGLQQASDACDQLQVTVSPASAPSDALGRGMLKASRGGRCSFNVSGLPSNTELQVGLTAGAGLKCDNGAAPTITPEPKTVKLGDYATVNHDFTLSCGA
ncbi:hypothetical protein [Pyxidicoccus xibeiensis]|uniref:hypothetical protein n=1 Tax=Pyxidicoccus xibeiensis TaxID=2906759 RepID=UPI0020A72DE5|nr:hypothetical protein [Pyxidicoccus xibeiensis]MCP3143061.1 hypothetical protein [Pyxidicoccus xibeiensis]